MSDKTVIDDLRTYTAKTSDVARQLAFAAIAVVWLFKSEVAGRSIVPAKLLRSAEWAVASLALDFAQYVYGCFVITLYLAITKKHDERPKPGRILSIASVLFWAKIICLVVSYTQLFRYLRSAVGAAG